MLKSFKVKFMNFSPLLQLLFYFASKVLCAVPFFVSQKSLVVYFIYLFFLSFFFFFFFFFLLFGLIVAKSSFRVLCFGTIYFLSLLYYITCSSI